MGDSCQLQSADCSLVDDTSAYYELLPTYSTTSASLSAVRVRSEILGGFAREKGIASIPSQQRVERKHTFVPRPIGHLTCRCHLKWARPSLRRGGTADSVRIAAISGRGQVSGRSGAALRRSRVATATSNHIHKISHQSNRNSITNLFRHNSINLPSLLSYSLLKRNGYCEFSKK